MAFGCLQARPDPCPSAVAQEGPGPSGTKFVAEVEDLYAREQHAQLLERFMEHLDLVLSKTSSDQGEGGSGGAQL